MIAQRRASGSLTHTYAYWLWNNAHRSPLRSLQAPQAVIHQFINDLPTHPSLNNTAPPPPRPPRQPTTLASKHAVLPLNCVAVNNAEQYNQFWDETPVKRLAHYRLTLTQTLRNIVQATVHTVGRWITFHLWVCLLVGSYWRHRPRSFCNSWVIFALLAARNSWHRYAAANYIAYSRSRRTPNVPCASVCYKQYRLHMLPA